jgi:hypothetical protein
MISSAARFEAPITFVGRTALSVEMRMQVSAPASSAAGPAYACRHVVEPLLRAPLDQRYVLVGGGVVDRLHATLAQHRPEKSFVCDRAEKRTIARPGASSQLHDGVERELGMVEQDQLPRVLGDLAAELAADRSAPFPSRAGDVAGEQSRVRRRGPARSVGDVDLAQVATGPGRPRARKARRIFTGAALTRWMTALLRRAGRRNGNDDCSTSWRKIAPQRQGGYTGTPHDELCAEVPRGRRGSRLPDDRADLHGLRDWAPATPAP